jgi:hypothetical protein
VILIDRLHRPALRIFSPAEEFRQVFPPSPDPGISAIPMHQFTKHCGTHHTVAII